MKISKTKILKEATEIRKFIENNKKLPTYATIDNSRLTKAQYTYLLVKLTSKISLDNVEKNTINEPSLPNGEYINEKVLKSDYLDMANRIVEYIEKYKQLPNFCTTKKSRKKVRFELYVYCFSKILDYYNTHKSLPNYCLFNSNDLNQTTSKATSNTSKTTAPKKSNCKNPYTSSPHYTEQGCNRLGQCTNYYCAPHSIHQCLKKLGITSFNEQTLAKWASTTTSGTSHEGINTCLAKVSKDSKIPLKVTWKNFSDFGSTKKERYLNLAKLLCKDNVALFFHIGYQGSGSSATGKIFGHYECLDRIDMSSSKVRALNSLGNKCGSGYCGHLQERSFNLQSTFIASISQKSVCIIEKI